MRILLLHNTYQQAGGEDAVVAREAALLRKFGHEVYLHCVSNDSIQGFFRKAITAWRAPYSPWGRRETKRIIKETRPDILHVHNFFPLLTPSVYDACKEENLPVVQTLHNYRTICAGALLMRDGKPCEDCVQGSPYQAVLHGCYRGSKWGSLAVARMIDTHQRQKTWARKVDRFIALSQFSKNKFIEGGFPSEKIAVKPNFVNSERNKITINQERKGALFVGRLSQEKGLVTMINAWKNLDIPLRVIGDGPLMNWVKDNSSAPHISVLGRKEPEQVVKEMNNASFLVMPYECYENFPLTLAEAFAQGLPVVASRLGAMAEIIEDGITGLHFNPSDPDDLARKVHWANTHAEEMERMEHNARKTYENKYTPKINYDQLVSIYREAIEVKRLKVTTNDAFTH